MKVFVVLALAILSLPISVSAQTPPAPADEPSARNGLNEQLDHLNARIDRRLARGRISQEDATKAHRKVNDLQAEVSADRLSDGGQLSESRRFDLQARISRFKAQFDRERRGGR